MAKFSLEGIILPDLGYKDGAFLVLCCHIPVSAMCHFCFWIGAAPVTRGEQKKEAKDLSFVLHQSFVSLVCLSAAGLLSRAEESGWSDGLSVLFFLQSRQEVGNDEGASADEYHVIGPGSRLCCGISFAHGGVALALEPVGSCFPGKLLA